MTGTNEDTFSAPWGRMAIVWAVMALPMLVCGQAFAADWRGRWYAGGQLSYLTTTDSIRSNAAIFVGPYGNDGLPGTGDPGEALTCNDTGAFCDPRPDHLASREGAIEDGLRLDLTLGFGMTRRFALQLDASWFEGEVGPLDYYAEEVYPYGSVSGVGLTSRQISLPARIGSLTEVPVSISGIFRFRPDAAFNPYLGLGAGVLFTRFSADRDLEKTVARLESQRIRGKTDEFGISLLAPGSDILNGNVPLAPHELELEIDDAYEWHLTGGTEYAFNDRVSLILDARYTFADAVFGLTLGGEDQVDFTTFPEPLFRPGGGVLFFNDSGRAPNPFCSDAPGPVADTRYGCYIRDGPPDPVTGERTLRLIPGARVKCIVGTSAQSDFDGDGNQGGGADVCYSLTIFTNNQVAPGVLEPTGQVVVQGGAIDLSGFDVAVGLRVYF